MVFQYAGREVHVLMRTTPVKPGTKWAMLTVIKAVDKNESSQVLWEVKCDCGMKTRAWGYNLVKGKKISCGCTRRQGGLLVKATAKVLPPPEPPEEKEIVDLGAYISEELGDADRVVRAFLIALKDLHEDELAVTVKRKWRMLQKAEA